MPKTKKTKKIAPTKRLKKAATAKPKGSNARPASLVLRRDKAKKPSRKGILSLQDKPLIPREVIDQITFFAPAKAQASMEIKKIAAQPIIYNRPNAKPSRHILDLKEFQKHKDIIKHQGQKGEDAIYQDIANQFESRKGNFTQGLKGTYSKLHESFTKFKTTSNHSNTPSQNLDFEVQEIKKQPQPKLSRLKLSLPSISLPQMNFKMPKLSFPEIKLGNIVLPAYGLKSIAIFILFCLIFVTPFNLYSNYQKLQGKKNDVLAKTAEAILHLTTSTKAASARDLHYTQYELQQSANSFKEAQQELTDVNIILKNLIKLEPTASKQYQTAQNLINAGEKLSQSAALLTETIDKIEISKDTGNLNLNDNLLKLKDALNLVLPDLQSANQDLETIYLEEIPTVYQEKIVILQKTIPLLTRSVETYINAADLLVQMLGQENPKRYLLLFQNNNEIRPTGGFIGSYALVDIDRGNIKNIEIPGGGPYDLKANLKINLESPRPLHIMNPRWEFQDGNWFADLPDSAIKLMYLYEKSGGPTVDGIIFINASLAEKILEVTGPVDLPKYNLQITADNFFNEIQQNVELDYDKEANKPKQIIADLAPILINRLLNSTPKNFAALFDLLLSSLNQKELQFYFSDPSLENIVNDYNWGGQLKNTDNDYLAIVSTNIAGEKTDAKIQQLANLSVKINEDGTITNTLKITRTHLGLEGEKFYGVPNVDYLRIYVPNGSELISAEGFEPIPPELFIEAEPEIYTKDKDYTAIEQSKKIDPLSQTEIFTESDKTVFANWLKTNPGETKSVIIQYKLPFTLNLSGEKLKTASQTGIKEYIGKLLKPKEEINTTETYSLLWQKQSGRRNFLVNAEIVFPRDLSYQLIYPADLQQKNNDFTYTSPLNSDQFLSILFKP
ncbi:MAG: DUF4012 domain-containing protein [Candidatus Parcubacteria bacterium]|nr:DUF4012 domain-containing protein [Candidatus Parcubacteria bacterium]